MWQHRDTENLSMGVGKGRLMGIKLLLTFLISDFEISMINL